MDKKYADFYAKKKSLLGPMPHTEGLNIFDLLCKVTINIIRPYEKGLFILSV